MQLLLVSVHNLIDKEGSWQVVQGFSGALRCHCLPKLYNFIQHLYVTSPAFHLCCLCIFCRTLFTSSSPGIHSSVKEHLDIYVSVVREAHETCLRGERQLDHHHVAFLLGRKVPHDCLTREKLCLSFSIFTNFLLHVMLQSATVCFI